MTISAVALFGSQARGDSEENSDVDLLLVTSEDTPRHVTMGNLSLSLYPRTHLFDRARKGDLFVCHLAAEAKAIHDPEGVLPALKEALKLRSSYDTEIAAASDLGWLLARFARDLPDVELANRRIAWCVRTILIARSAEAGKPVFSAAHLAAFAGDSRIGELINQKNSDEAPSLATTDQLRGFLQGWGKTDPVPGASKPSDYRPIFRHSDNRVALATLKGRSRNADY